MDAFSGRAGVVGDLEARLVFLADFGYVNFGIFAGMKGDVKGGVVKIHGSGSVL